jgi:hypothetical protein
LSDIELDPELVPADRERIRRQLGLLAAAQSRLHGDPFPHYLAHCRVQSAAGVTDVLLTSGERNTHPRSGGPGILIADYAQSAFGALFFASREGRRHATSRAARGLVLERNVVGFGGRKLVDIITESHVLSRRQDGIWRRLPGLPRHVLRVRSAAQRKQPPSLIDVHLDPAQRRVVELPASRSVLVLGEAGHGKTTVALHRLAQLVRSSERALQVAVIVPSVGLERLLDPLLEQLQIAADVRVYDRWAIEQARRAFPGICRRVSESATASVIRFKRDPALGLAIETIAQRRVSRVDDERAAPARHTRGLVSRGDLQHLFGDRELITKVVRASREPIGAHGIAELLEHTRIQFSRRSEQEHAHVDRARLRTVDGRPIDAGTPLEDAGSIDAEDCAVAFEIERQRASRRGREPLAPKLFDVIVLDEAQELAPLELALIGRSLAPGGSLVVAGDADQQTDPAAFFGGWEHTMTTLRVADYERVTLSVNYRCPPKVVAVAKRLIASTALTAKAQPEAPATEAAWLDFVNEADLGCWLIGELRELRRRDRRGSVAVICRLPSTAQRLTRLLRHAFDARLVLDGAFALEAGINVTTVDQVKGLEFDYVFVPDASALNYPDQPSSRRALYVAVTRSRHELALGAVTARTPLLGGSKATADATERPAQETLRRR